jgi:hypothetical protein
MSLREQHREARGSTYAAPIAAWIACLVLAIAASAWVALYGAPAAIEAWHASFVLLAGFVAASIGLLMIGHGLGDLWLHPVRDELEPAAWMIPIVAVLALPVLLRLDVLYPWMQADVAATLPAARRAYLDPAWFSLRTAFYLAVWFVLTVIVARPGRGGRMMVIGIVPMLATMSLASVDWIMTREPAWWSSLFGFAFTISQFQGALAAAVLITLVWQQHPEPRPFRSLERALLTLLLATLWVWFSQFLVVWMTDVPGEAAWYLARFDASRWASWGVLELYVVLPSLFLAIALLIPPRIQRWRLLAAGCLALVHHIAHMLWIILPAGATPLDAPALAVFPLVGAIALGAFLAGMWLRARLHVHDSALTDGTDREA